jgi:Caspase domain
MYRALSIFFLLICTCAAAQDHNDSLRHGKALLIGVSHYDDQRWDDLDDVPIQLNALKGEFSYHFDDVSVVIGKTGKEILSIIRNFLEIEGNKKNSRLLIYYSGHGYTELYELKSAFVGYVTGRDTAYVDHSKEAYNAARPNAISMDEIRVALSNSKAESVLFIFDSCFSGSFFQSKSPDDSAIPWSDDIIHTLMGRPARFVITAGTKDQKVPASSPIPDLVVRALHGGADFSKISRDRGRIEDISSRSVATTAKYCA